MEENKFMKKSREWVGLVGDADSFTVPVAKTYGHVEEYLRKLNGNENKREVASTVAKIVEKAAPYYLSNCPIEYSVNLEESFQILVDSLCD